MQHAHCQNRCRRFSGVWKAAMRLKCTEILHCFQSIATRVKPVRELWLLRYATCAKLGARAIRCYPWALELGLMEVCCRCLCCELPPTVPCSGPAKPAMTLLASLLKPVGTADKGPEAVEKAGVLLGCPVGIKTCHHEPRKCRQVLNQCLVGRHACY